VQLAVEDLLMGLPDCYVYSVVMARDDGENALMQLLLQTFSCFYGFALLISFFSRGSKYEFDVSQFSVRYEYLLLACPAKARR
jgi:hypothetical protein